MKYASHHLYTIKIEESTADVMVVSEPLLNFKRLTVKGQMY
jgi:hypothetical protein